MAGWNAPTKKRPLTPEQIKTARELDWYRRWLLSTGRTEAEIDGEQATK